MDDLVSLAVEHVRRRSDGAPMPPGLAVTLNFHPDTPSPDGTMIEQLAREGVYRSQFETRTSNGGLTAYPGGDRWRWESRLFGGAYDDDHGAVVEMRPKYGALNYLDRPHGGSHRFGSCHLRLNPGVLGRTTFCYPDSFMTPERFGTADRMALIALAVANEAALDLLDDYIEAHVHGRLSVADDVAAIVLDPSYRGTTIETAARSLPCAVEWHDGFRLPRERLADCERYRGPDAARTLEALEVDGFVTPADIGQARRNGLDYQLAKWAWHCVARFGAAS
ncbi:hypothetical protein ASD21_17905 [Caulobacter sp. Root1455]|jgi:hypothetical protein|nr:hypothetical protein ASD21_17905 [Caulobacter sp. Root1455]